VIVIFINVVIYSLPDELVLKILDYLTPADLLSSARVCRRWLNLTNDKLVLFMAYGEVVKIKVKVRTLHTAPVYDTLCKF